LFSLKIHLFQAILYDDNHPQATKNVDTIK